MVRNKDKNTSSPLFVPRFDFTPTLPTPPPPPLHPAAQGVGNGGLRSVHNGFSLPFLPPHTIPLLQRGSFPHAAVLNEVLQRVSTPWAAVYQDKPDPAWVLHGPQLLSGEPAPPWALLHWLQFPSRNIHLLYRGVLHSGYLLQHGPLHGLQANLLLRRLEHHLPSFFLLLWPWCLQSCFSHISTHPPHCPCSILPFINYIFPEMQPAWPRGSAVPGSRSHMGSPGRCSQRPLRPPWHAGICLL